MLEEENVHDQKTNIFRRCFKSPIDINVINTEQIKLPELNWMNYGKMPQSMELENSGETCMLCIFC